MLRRSILVLVLVVGGLWVAACTQPAGGASSPVPDASATPLDTGGKYGY